MTKQSILDEIASPASPNRDDNIPQQYIKGYVEFYKLRFKVTPDVLIPRPETELLVDEVLKFVRDSHVANAPQNDTSATLSAGVIAILSEQSESKEKQSRLTILDLGTGSGAIAISIAKNLHPTSGLPAGKAGVGVKIIATDISGEALEIAKQNAKLHNVEKQITFMESDLLNAFCHSGKSRHGTHPESDSGVASLPRMTFDIIVTNLPYIPTYRIPYLDSSVKDFEPHVALDGGEDGFELYRKLFQQLSLTPRRCKPKLIVGEIDYTHGELAVIESQKYFPDAKAEVKTDLAHKQRILLISTD